MLQGHQICLVQHPQLQWICFQSVINWQKNHLKTRLPPKDQTRNLQPCPFRKLNQGVLLWNLVFVNYICHHRIENLETWFGYEVAWIWLLIKLVLLPICSSSTKCVTKEPETAPMTIFYGGQVIVFNDFPAEPETAPIFF